MTAMRGGQIVRHYQVKDEALRKTASMGNTSRLESDEPDLKLRGDLILRLRTTDRRIQLKWVREIDGVAQLPTIARKPKRRGEIQWRSQK